MRNWPILLLLAAFAALAGCSGVQPVAEEVKPAQAVEVAKPEAAKPAEAGVPAAVVGAQTPAVPGGAPGAAPVPVPPPPPTAAELLALANNAFTARDYKEALAGIAEARKTDPKIAGANELEAKVHFALATAAFEAKDYVTALAKVVDAYKVKPDFPEARALGGKILFALASKAFDAKDYKTALDMVAKVRKSDPDFPGAKALEARIHFTKANIAYEAKDFEEALSEVYETRRVLPDFPGVAMLEARTRFALGDATEGLPLMARLIGQVETGRPEGGRDLIHTYARWAVETGHGQQAVQMLSALVDDVETPDPELVAALGWVNFTLGDYAEARKRFEQIEQTATGREFAVFLAKSRLILGDSQGAALSARIARAAAPASSEAGAEAGVLLADIDRLEGRASAAENGYAEVLGQYPGHYSATVNLGILKLGQGDAKAAAELFRSATAKRADLPDAWNNLGLALRAIGDFNGALDAYKKALEVDPKHLPALKNIAILHEKYLGKPADALPFYEKYIAVKGPDEEVERWIKAAKRTLGEKPGTGEGNQ
jgi:tetratricopeptide (TPR) repeat protein